jgi:hypothetical protein
MIAGKSGRISVKRSLPAEKPRGVRYAPPERKELKMKMKKSAAKAALKPNTIVKLNTTGASATGISPSGSSPSGTAASIPGPASASPFGVSAAYKTPAPSSPSGVSTAIKTSAPAIATGTSLAVKTSAPANPSPAVQAAPAVRPVVATAPAAGQGGFTGNGGRPAAPLVTAPVVRPPVATAPVTTAAGTKEALTTIEVKRDVGFGNTVFMRGQGAGLTWERGLPLVNVDAQTWRWSGLAKDPITFKLLINDQIWSAGGDLMIKPGQKLEVAPEFA